MQFCMGMVKAQWMFFCSDVVSQYQIHFKKTFTVADDWVQGVVFFTVTFCIDECAFVSVVSLSVQDMICKIYQTPFITAFYP